MIFDLLDFEAQTSVEADVCIIGAGAAGITLSLSLIDSGKQIVVLESGGFDFDESVQSLADGQNVGRPYFDLDGSRLRMLGGSTNHWQGECTIFDAIDFEERPWVPYSGWPLTMQEMLPWYQKAHTLLGLGTFDYNPESVRPSRPPLAAYSDIRLVHKVWRHSDPPVHFGATFSEQLGGAENLDLFLHANFTDLKSDSHGRHFQMVVAESGHGHSLHVKARTFVFAAGGLENPRLLLSLQDTTGIPVGNARGLVGRFFMEHINLVGAEVLPLTDGLSEPYEQFSIDDQLIQHRIVMSYDQQRELGALNSAASLTGKEINRSTSAGYGSLHHVRKDLRRGRIPDQLGLHIYRIATDLTGIWNSILERGDESLWVSIEGEQAPNPESRVILTNERDALGMRILALDWRLSDIDLKSIHALLGQLGNELGRLGLGRLRLEPVVRESVNGDTPSDQIYGGYHHMGTTRMGASEIDGVVDVDSRVFGAENLFIAGSSVFPTSGCANPTLTIVALALRLGNHLRRNVL